LASENATTSTSSPSVRTATFWALTLPPRGATTSSTPRSAQPRTMSSVPSLEASETTTMRSSSRG
jgi:hypothetical protein